MYITNEGCLSSITSRKEITTLNNPNQYTKITTTTTKYDFTLLTT